MSDWPIPKGLHYFRSPEGWSIAVNAMTPPTTHGVMTLCEGRWTGPDFYPTAEEAAADCERRNSEGYESRVLAVEVGP